MRLGSKILIVVVGLVTAGMLLSCAATGKTKLTPADEIRREYDPDELRADLEYLWDTLHEVHPDLYALVDKDSLRRKFVEIDSSLTQPMTRIEFYLKIAPLVAMIKDGHTYLSLPFEPDLLSDLRSVLFPFDLVYIGNKTYILQDYSRPESHRIGAELLAINDTPIENITRRFTTLLQGETASFVTKSLESDLFKIFFWMLYPDESMWNVTYQKPGREPVSEIVIGVTGNEMVAMRKRRSGQPRYTHSLTIYPQKKAAVMSVQTFRGSELKPFYRRSFHKLNQNQIEYLVIDLRDNLGGNTANADELLSYLTDEPLLPISRVRMKVSSQLKQYYEHYVNDIFEWLQVHVFSRRHQQVLQSPEGEVIEISVKESIQPQPLRRRFHGQVFVLTNGHSFSAGAYFPSFIQHYHLGYVVGVETGGLSGGSFGERIPVELPRTNLSVGISTIVLKQPPLDNFEKHGVIPDFTVQRDIDKEVTGVDSQLEQTLDMVDSNSYSESK
ncbi:MAG TPA: S41 family peptidase [bacterium]|nr:S41 family peptidase [bacterium]